MIRRITGTAGAAALLTIGIGAVSASATPVNRPLADEMTQQFNQQELQQLQAGDVTIYAPADTAYSVELGPPGTALPPMGMSPAGGPPQPLWRYLPR